MKNKLYLFGLLILLLASQIATAQARTLRVLLIGNSFSQNATRFLPEMAKEGGHELILGRAELGGHSLKQHWSYVEAAQANPDDPKGKPYGGKSLRTLLLEQPWDVVTMQQASVYSSDIETYRPYAKNLSDFIHSVQPRAILVLHQTWAYRSDAKEFGFVDEKAGKRAQSQREMWEKLHGAYHTTARELGVRLIPVGDAFWRVTNDAKWGYKVDANYDFAKPTHPALPDQSYSLNVGYSWRNPTSLGADYNHASVAGCYLGGAVWYRFLFEQSPESLTFVPKGLDPAFAAFLRQQAAQVAM